MENPLPLTMLENARPTILPYLTHVKRGRHLHQKKIFFHVHRQTYRMRLTFFFQRTFYYYILYFSLYVLLYKIHTCMNTLNHLNSLTLHDHLQIWLFPKIF